jgi:hypothetical protein
MSKLTTSEFDVLTNELSVRELTKQEISALEAKAIAKSERIAKAEAEAEAKEVAKAAILDRLGLTADELKTILG